MHSSLQQPDLLGVLSRPVNTVCRASQMNLYARRETKTLEFKKALKVIYNRLKDTDVNWVIVGSFGLADRGLPIEPHDVHIMTVNTTPFRHRPRAESQHPMTESYIAGRLTGSGLQAKATSYPRQRVGINWHGITLLLATLAQNAPFQHIWHHKFARSGSRASFCKRKE